MKLTLATPQAIRYACKNFHYSGSVPSVQYGFNIYNSSGEWCGVICFGGGATPRIGMPFDLCQGEILELVRVALNGKQNKTSQCVAAAMRELHRRNPLVKIVVSYASLDENHKGIIYQATNWLYLGEVKGENTKSIIINGRNTHKRTVGARYGTTNIEYLRKHIDPEAKICESKGRYKYIYCFDKKLRKKWQKASLPYPK